MEYIRKNVREYEIIYLVVGGGEGEVVGSVVFLEIGLDDFYCNVLYNGSGGGDCCGVRINV